MSFTLQDLENSLPPDIVQKGLDYFVGDRVINVVSEGNVRKAEVLGTKKYSVAIILNKDQIKNCHCDCPYSLGPICKHIAAVLFAIRNEKQEAELKEMPYFKKRKG